MRAKGKGKLPLVQRLSEASVIPSVQARMKAIWLGKKRVWDYPDHGKQSRKLERYAERKMFLKLLNF